MSQRTTKFTHKYEVQNIHLVLDFLQMLSACHNGMSLSAFVGQMPDICKNKIFRILHTLETDDFVTKSPDGEYRLGSAAYCLARNILANDHKLARIRSVQQQLAALTHEAVYLGTISDDELLLIEMLECKKAVRVASCIGERFCFENGELIRNTPGYRMYLDHHTHLPGVSIVTVITDCGAGEPRFALALVLPTCRISDDTHSIISACELSLATLCRRDDTHNTANTVRQRVSKRTS